MTDGALGQCECGQGQGPVQRRRRLVNFGWVALWVVVTTVWVFFIGPLTMQGIAQFAVGPNAYAATHEWVAVAAVALIGLFTWLSLAVTYFAFANKSGDLMVVAAAGVLMLPLLAPVFGFALGFLIGAIGDMFPVWHAVMDR